MKIDATTISIGPNMELALPGGDTIAYMNGSAPHLFVRDGSDAYKLPPGQCVPVVGRHSANIRLINPFPRHVECLIGRGLPVQYAPEAPALTAEQRAVVMSHGSVFREAQGVPTNRFGLGVMAKKGRGRLAVTVFDYLNDGQTRLMIFQNVSPDMLALRPPGFMDIDNPIFRESDGRPDTDLVSIRGSYTEALYNDFMSAVGNPASTNFALFSGLHGGQQVIVDDTSAVFVLRPVDGLGIKAAVFVRHLGTNLEDFD